MWQLDDLPPLDCILITQGYDDHCHKRTLQALVKRFSDVRVIASPNAKSIISDIGYTNVCQDGLFVAHIPISHA